MRFVVFVFATLSSLAAASDFANCAAANKQLKMLNDFMKTDLRIAASQVLIKEIEQLRPHIEKNTTGLPDKLIKLCYNIKRQAFQATYLKGGANLYGSYEFLIAAGKFFFFEKAWPTSLDSFEGAARLRPNLFEPNYLALQALIYTQITAEKPISANSYQRKIKGFVDNMMKAKDIKPEERKVMMSFLAQAEEKISKTYSARTMLEKSVSLNPQDKNIRLQLGELEERAGRFNNAKKVYEDALAVKTPDAVAEKKILTQLSRMYVLFGEEAKLKALVTRALNAFPQDAYFKQLNQSRMPANVKK